MSDLKGLGARGQEEEVVRPGERGGGCVHARARARTRIPAAYAVPRGPWARRAALPQAAGRHPAGEARRPVLHRAGPRARAVLGSWHRGTARTRGPVRVRACVRVCVRACVRACMHACMHACMRALILGCAACVRGPGSQGAACAGVRPADRRVDRRAARRGCGRESALRSPRRVL